VVTVDKAIAGLPSSMSKGAYAGPPHPTHPAPAPRPAAHNTISGGGGGAGGDMRAPLIAGGSVSGAAGSGELLPMWALHKVDREQIRGPYSTSFFQSLLLLGVVVLMWGHR
jgi:hypothetical protein